jgi:hypothetical protein
MILWKKIERLGMNRTKLFLLFLLALLTGISCKEETAGSKEKAHINFEEKVHDFGTIDYMGDGRCYFSFKNDSEKDLIINTVRTSCGCTRPEWPREPVKPGEEGRIGISYNTRLTGRFQKSITVYSNAENSPVKLTIKGIVNKEKQK